jgi:hypothetical protein
MTVVLLLVLSTVAMWTAWRMIRALHVWRRLRGARVVTCPETRNPAGVEIDVHHAVMAALAGHDPDIRLASCSRWPARSGCGEPCLGDAVAEKNTTCRIAERGFKDKMCVYCRKPIGDPHFLDHYAALQGPDGITVEWPDVRPEHLADALQTDAPVCWNCHIAETFRRLQ